VKQQLTVLTSKSLVRSQWHGSSTESPTVHRDRQIDWTDDSRSTCLHVDITVHKQHTVIPL